MFPLPLACTHKTRLPSEARILELWDTSVFIISGTFTYSVCSSLPYYGLGELVSILGHCKDPYHFTIRPDGPRHGSRSRPGFTSRDFKDLGTCLQHHTSGYTCRLVGYSFYSFAYGQEYYFILVHHILLLLRHMWKLWA